MKRGERYRLTIERPAAGGRMIARHEGAIVFVSGAIPGEVIEAEVEKVQRATVWAATKQIVERSADRVDAPEGACGGSVFAHIAYDRQRQIKSAIIEDAFRRIGRITLESPVEVVASGVDGYRMRARLHVRNGRIGFFREGTHSICDAASTRQLRDDTIAVIRRLEASLAKTARPVVGDIEIAENVDASERAIHFELLPDADPSGLAALAYVDGVGGASCAHAENPRTMELFGSTIVSDTIRGVTLSRHVRSFFQGNRYLLAPFVDHVLSHVSTGPLVDLYAGVGIFSLTAATAGAGPIAAVEGDRFAARDLKRNAAGRITVLQIPVEEFSTGSAQPIATVIVDPPRTGMSKDALERAIAVEAPRFVYVSCDVATLARDARVLLDAGYRLSSMRAFDLFPHTAHVETVIAFSR
ncbi:MAG: TRAM domain-containing protein [Cyanobacteria bacterium]|nr:TRAM domain-containing protein [Cyanobacteriota bacterium]